MTACPAGVTTFTSKEWLAAIHVIMISIMSVFMVQIYKIRKEQQANVQKPCLSPVHAQIYKKFVMYKDIVFYSISASFVLSLMFLSIQFKVSFINRRWLANATYILLMASGAVGIGFSVDGFLKARSLSSLPVECNSLKQQFYIFFILSMSISVAQTFFSIYILYYLYNPLK